MEFTRGPKYSPKYFIIEIVPWWVIKLEGTFSSRSAVRKRGKAGSPGVHGHKRERRRVGAHLHGIRARSITGGVEILVGNTFMMVNSICVRGTKKKREISTGWVTIGSGRRRTENQNENINAWYEKSTECVYVCVRSRKESFLGKGGAKREKGREREDDSGVQMKATAGTRRVQVGQVWRTEVPYGPRKPAPALRPPGPRATSLSVLSLATTIYHLRGPVIPSHLRLSVTDTRAREHIRGRERRARVFAYNRLQTHLLRSYSFIENYWLRYVYRVFFRDLRASVLYSERVISIMLHMCESRREEILQ